MNYSGGYHQDKFWLDFHEKIEEKPVLTSDKLQGIDRLVSPIYCLHNLISKLD